MSLYFDAVTILTKPPSTGGSFKSRIYNARNLKAAPAQIYALITETSKWDILLKEVIERAELIKLETRLSPHLALFLVHDHLLSKKGIAAPANHALRLAVERHKARLKGEFIKARVRWGCASIEELKTAVLREKKALGGDVAATAAVYPRWVRINTVRTTLDTQLTSTFAAYQRVDSLAGLVQDDQPRLFVDLHIPDLVAVPPGVELTSSPAYKNGEIILQDKASCFPAYLLGDEREWKGDVVDACAAPGNKTTHLAALLSKHTNKKNATSRIISMDASPTRSKTLKKMVSAAGAGDIVTVLAGQDFLALDPTADSRFEQVAGLLLDPSCSGSGIIGRDDVPQLLLPSLPEGKKQGQGKKRKREEPPEPANLPVPTATAATDENDLPNTPISHERLTKLSNIQTRIVEHALSFPAALRVTYSTCSIHLLENESVVQRVLRSAVARRRGWRVLRREEQPVGLRGWKARGVRKEDKDGGDGDGDGDTVDLSQDELDGCLRCWPGDEEGVGGFFVVGFVRDGSQDGSQDGEDGEDDEWGGFSD